MVDQAHIPTVSVTYAQTGASAKANEMGMRPMQERVYERRGEQYLLIKSPPASGKSRALMFVALDKLHSKRRPWPIDFARFLERPQPPEGSPQLKECSDARWWGWICRSLRGC